MPENEMQAKKGISLGKGMIMYVIFIVATLFLLSMTIKIGWVPWWLLIIVYFTFGFVLNRVVLRSLIEWHPMYNTLYNVSSAKFNAFLFWPFSYAILFVRLAVNKIL
jgi:fatty acid desaturase